MNIDRSTNFWNSTCWNCGRPRKECYAEPCDDVLDDVAEKLAEELEDNYATMRKSK